MFPDGYDDGVVTYRAYWTHSAGTAFGVAWALQGVALDNSDSIDATYGTAVVRTDTGGTNEDLFFSPESGNITIAGVPGAGDCVVFRVFRDVSDAGDTLDADARLIGIRIFYTTDAAVDS